MGVCGFYAIQIIILLYYIYMAVNYLFIVCFLLGVVFSGQTPALWSGSASYKSAMVTLITSSGTKTGSNNMNFASAFGGTPKMVFGIHTMQAAAGDILEFYVTKSSLTATGISISWKVGASTSISSMGMYYIGIDSSISVLGTFVGVVLENYISFSNISSGSGFRYAQFMVNFTSSTGESMNLAHTVKMLVFTNSINMKRNSGKFNWTVSGVFVNSNNYTLTLFTSGNTTISNYTYSRIIFDQTALQATQLTYVDAGELVGLNTAWASLTLSIPWKNSTNFMVGMSSMAYEAAVGISYTYSQPTLTASGSMTFNNLSMSYFNYRYRSCPAGFPFFNEANSLCYDVCSAYYYGNTSQSACLPCYYTCYTCSNVTNTTCLSCNSTTDHRILTGTNCVCAAGFYQTGAVTCAACNYTCATCTNGTACVTCPATRTLTSGQCPCNAGFVDAGSATCVSCSTAMMGCLNCTSATACTVCDTANKFSLSSMTCVCSAGTFLNGTVCSLCSNAIPGCTSCTSATVCTACNTTSLFTLNGSICKCNSGYYLSGSTCTACTMTGCTNCTAAATCTTCNSTKFFTLTGSTCVCISGYYLSGTTCTPCTTLTGCLTCTSSTSCLTCNTTKFFTLSGSTCVCQTGYYLSAGSCLSCSTAMTGCTACTAVGACTTCQSPLIVNSGLCSCGPAYYQSGTSCIACSSAMTGCTACTVSTTCTTCDTAANFVVNGSLCSCKAGYYLSGTTCLKCMSGCGNCTTAAICGTCNATANFVSSGAICVCDSANGYVLSGGVCVQCSTVLIGCTSCTSTSVCTSCNAADPYLVGPDPGTNTCSCDSMHFFNASTGVCEVCTTCCPYGQYLDTTTLPGTCLNCFLKFISCLDCDETQCTSCAVGTYLNGLVCESCTVPMPGCTSCSSNSVCGACDNAIYFQLSSSSCVCMSGYTLTGTTCSTCNSTLPGCLVCTSPSVCTTCDLSNNFVVNTSNTAQCICSPGYYLAGASCVACTMLGCTECSGASTCTVCDSSLMFTLSGSNCVCLGGYYLDSGTTCLLCSTALDGCLACTDSSTCTHCDVSLQMQLLPMATTCSCISGFYFSGSPCTVCPNGCTSCTSITCSTCDTAGGFGLNGTSCDCITSKYLEINNTCQNCATKFELCTECTIGGCTGCIAPTVPSGGICVCGPGYYNNTLGCDLCSSQFLGCTDCILGTCTTCDAGLFFTVSSGVCVCMSGYVLTGGQCVLCSSLMNGCSTCSSSAICDSCDGSLFFTLSSGTCVCSSGYFLNSTSNCQTCQSALVGCATCTNNSTCTACIPASNFLLQANHTCSCADMYVLSGANCVSCLISCVCVGYQWDVNGQCTPFCSDRITISPPEECDDGNLNAGDGCSPTCVAETNYSCSVTAMVSFCSWNQRLEMNMNSLIKDPAANKLTFTFDIEPANLTDLSTLNFQDLIVSDIPLYNGVFIYQNGVLSITYDFNETLHGTTGTMTINPNWNSKFFATPPTVINITIDPTNNLPAVVYDNTTYEDYKKLQTVYNTAVYTSYGIMFLGMFCDKVIGVELFGVLQLAYLSVSDLNSVQPLLSPLMNMSIVNGYNPEILQKDTYGMPKRVREIGYDTVFINNFGVMFALVLVDIVVAVGVLTVGYLVPKYNETTKNIAKRMLKEYLLMLVTFNSLNIAYSVGVSTSYSKANDSFYIMNLALGFGSLLLPLGIVCGIIFTEKKQFGEFSKHYKRDLFSQGYFVITLIYRLALGFTMSKLNEVQQATIIDVFFSIIFMMYLMTNLPYVKGYHNHRAVIIQATGIAILSTTMYYRSMKSTTSPEKTYKIIAPALVQIAMIFGSIGISAGCLFYELYLKYIKAKQDKENQLEHNSEEDPSMINHTHVNLE